MSEAVPGTGDLLDELVDFKSRTGSTSSLSEILSNGRNNGFFASLDEPGRLDARRALINLAALGSGTLSRRRGGFFHDLRDEVLEQWRGSTIVQSLSSSRLKYLAGTGLAVLGTGASFADSLLTPLELAALDAESNGGSSRGIAAYLMNVWSSLHTNIDQLFDSNGRILLQRHRTHMVGTEHPEEFYQIDPLFNFAHQLLPDYVRGQSSIAGYVRSVWVAPNSGLSTNEILAFLGSDVTSAWAYEAADGARVYQVMNGTPQWNTWSRGLENDPVYHLVGEVARPNGQPSALRQVLDRLNGVYRSAISSEEVGVLQSFFFGDGANASEFSFMGASTIDYVNAQNGGVIVFQGEGPQGTIETILDPSVFSSATSVGGAGGAFDIGGWGDSLHFSDATISHDGVISLTIQTSEGPVEIVDLLDSDGDHVADVLGQQIIHEDGSKERKLFAFDEEMAARLYTLPNMGRALGSMIGNVLFDSTVEKLVGVPILSSVGARLGSLLNAGLDPSLEIEDVLDLSLSSLATEFAQGLVGEVIGTVSSFLTAEIMSVLGVEGTAGEILETGVSSAVSVAFDNVLAGRSWALGFTPETFWLDGGTERIVTDDAILEVEGVRGLGHVAANAIASYFGNKLGNALVSPNNETAAKLSSIASSFGSYLGKPFGPIGHGVGSFIGSTWGAAIGNANDTGRVVGVWSTVRATQFAYNFLNASGALAAGPLGAAILIGMAIGTIVASLFGKRKPKIPSADAETVLNFSTGYYEVGAVNSQHGGNEDLVRSMSEAARDSLNGVIGLVTSGSEIAGNANYVSPTQTYGHTVDPNSGVGKIWVKLGSSSYKTEFDSADLAVDYGAVWAIRQTKIVGGNLFLKRAIAGSHADSFAGLAGDLRFGQDMATYYQGKRIIDSAIAAPYESLSVSDRSFYDANKDNFSRVMAAPRNENGQVIDDGSGLSLSGATLSWYNSNQTRVDAIVTALAPSQFAAGWMVTLQQAAELGLNQTSRSDFYGGLGGLVDSLQIMKGDDLYAEDLRLTFNGTDLEIDAWGPLDNSNWVSDKADGVLHNEPFPEGWGEVWTADKLTTLGGFKAMAGTTATEPSQNAKSSLISQWENANFGYTFVDGGFVLQSASGLDSSAGNDIYLHSGSGGITIDDQRSETVSLIWVTASTGWGGLEFMEGGAIGTFTIEGGDDIFVGGSGNDTIRGRSGYDWLSGGDGNDIIYGGSEDDVILGGGGDDRLYGEDGDDYIAVGTGKDYWRSVNGVGTHYGAWGGNGNDTLVAGPGQAYLWGENGDDLFILEDGNQPWSRYNGGNGSDTLSFERFAAGVTVDMNVRYGGDPNQIWRTTHGDQHFVYMENLTGSEYDDELIGDGISNTLRGLGGQDILRGGSGNDILEGGVGADQLFGDGGSDTASYESSTSAVWLDFQEQEFFGGHAEGDTMSSIDRAIGSDFADTFFDRDNWNTRFWGGRGDDWFVVNRGSANADYFYGDEDFDTVDYADVSSAVTINLASNSHGGAASGNKLYDIEQIVGSDFNDTITMDGKDNYIQGGKGNDILNGGAGLDTYIYNLGDGNDTINEVEDGGGYDTLVMLGMNWADLTFSTPAHANGRNSALIINVADGGSVTAINNQYYFEDPQAVIDGFDVGGVGAVDLSRLNWAAGGGNGNDTVYGRSDKAEFVMGFAGNDTMYAA
ncbi:MAG: hypothetical protein JJ931_15535, partial [Henriciella sp.]|nr:hypothetical protein [Henriciella sp.]